MGSERLLDPLIAAADRALRAIAAPAHASRPYPGTVAATLTDAQRRESAALMRVNHAGEVAAQALYHGQALAARAPATRELLLKAAQEETEHLGWCEQRLGELGSSPSLLNPLWYCGSFAIGALAGIFGDGASLGFVAETERQVEGHLDEHLRRLPAADSTSRAVVDAMRADEIAHADSARAAGAVELPSLVKGVMRGTAMIMTQTAYWI
ncbi:MAG TPA: 2-polyprenyl-3-methyl-6-methoxy-1,4-benzoquinone monooxygenase [Steroidobacteraceae bacterium]|jgi:ubiquinone biosynthesis monooxygenase Coq7|nr:2-polyprenyl-3-methyl-6-methoxy-1,4-benzoquinone monooxygenase [Steroidobacteraceae bacterium]